ncbi:similar to Saccharomyces cerevisiae YLR207W HRD3 Resident protein of the ER membrane that plays a central role in ER-associated protein degradation (ERAD) [Maudiozyma barnettii]|uniref:Similar to Saccharomyces cerevisiae YLR207W HRD3 Resident protein of the ER membrane that plays a central role in ER-associated protein degradation (ERAD) n=1 Tax=Maudiozyma barnettii TaxID=61262 RepID=A0A8H2VEA2_9SACH|nr:ubiquitin ligase complex subunit HRD3 [Kazachstania barnettii]CAB4253965.1 similar to Saccharomyces cerevisiae YLR207W HRD3 Resident protein of the ER membrane that plays a central role in ER-associated protein degradation (ERAD) [Kazachstania barnettii]CAD1781715.1 similar to Saccharomyces cerevisiae YLR207W HRD3 Resident protein of the ER membrane that plays a central role in ER-associated protein degradation (ERAD) [Kazachstania barnettii]
MKFYKYIASLLWLQCINARQDDPWRKAKKLISQLIEKPDAIRHQPPEIVNNGDIRIYIPTGYNETYQELEFQKFWKESANESQINLHSWLTDSSDNYNNENATYTLAQIYLDSLYGIPHNKTLAFQYLDKYNNLTNYKNPETLFQQAVAYSTGLFGTIQIDSAKALLYYQRSARLGNLQAKQVLAYKYYRGINVPRDSNRALILYKEIADLLKQTYSEEQWSFQFPTEESFNIRIPDFEDGLLGTGLSYMSTSIYRKRSARPDITSSVLTSINGGNVVLRFGNTDRSNPFLVDENDETDDQIVDIFYTALDEYLGTYTSVKNTTRARLLLEATYEEYDTDVAYLDNLQRFFYGQCLDLLGHIYFTGSGLEKPDIMQAEKYLKRSIIIIESASTVKSGANVDLGLIYQYYYFNDTKAIEYYKKGRGKTNNKGVIEYQLSALTEQYPDLLLGSSFMLMEEAKSKGFVPAKYEYASMLERGVNDRYNCENTAYNYKSFVEENEGRMASRLRSAFNELLLGNTEVALWKYAQAAEQGYEMAQVSTAYLLYQIPLELDDPPITTDERKLLAVTYYTRAFKQNNIDAGVIAGDVYYSLGTYEKAFSLYQSAALKYSTQAIWNLAYMYEYGLGVPVDFHLAKRYYDQVLERNGKLYMAIKLNVMKLQLKSLVTWLLGRDRIPYKMIEEQKKVLIKTLKSGKKLFYKYFSWPFSNETKPSVGSHTHTITVESGWDNMVSKDGESEGFLSGFNLVNEDIFTLIIVVIFFFGSFFLRQLAERRGWNVQVNGVPVGQQNQENNQNNDNDNNLNMRGNGWNFEVQFFAI